MNLLISLIVLAAGKSVRFGENKLLYKIGEQTVIECVVENALGSKADEVILVLGYDAERVRRKLSGIECRFVYNAVFEEGQSSSVRVGVASVAEDSEAAIILPGDVVLISYEAIDRVIEEYRRTGSPIVVAAHEGRFGHPILFDKALFPEISQINEETHGLKAIVRRHKAQVIGVEAGSPAVLFDLDTQEDIKKISVFSGV